MNVEVDKLTPCLVRASDGEVVQTEVSVLSRRDARSYREDNGWYINWSEVPDDYTIYKLAVSGEDEPQGLVAAKDDRANQAVRLHWGVAAPWNQGKLVGADGKRYEGVGGHLFAIGADLSMQLGYNGFMVSQAANSKLLSHYVEEFGAYPIGNTLGFFIDEDAAAGILKEYTWER